MESIDIVHLAKLIEASNSQIILTSGEEVELSLVKENEHNEEEGNNESVLEHAVVSSQETNKEVLADHAVVSSQETNEEVLADNYCNDNMKANIQGATNVVIEVNENSVVTDENAVAVDSVAAPLHSVEISSGQKRPSLLNSTVKSQTTPITPEDIKGFYDQDKFDQWLSTEYPTKPSVWFSSTYEETSNIVKMFEEKTKSKFVTYFNKRNFGNTGEATGNYCTPLASVIALYLNQVSSSWLDPPRYQDLFNHNHKFLWDGEGMEFDGVPYVRLSLKHLDCHHGKNRSGPSKNKYGHFPHLVRKYQSHYDSKKRGCAAQIRLKELMRFPAHKIKANTKWRRENVSSKLRKALRSKTLTGGEKMFLIILPAKKDHTQHSLGEDDIREKIHHQIVMKIQELYLQNHSKQQIGKLISGYVTEEMGVSQTGSKRNKYHPTKEDIRYFVAHLRTIGRLSAENISSIKDLFYEHENSSLSYFSVDEVKDTYELNASSEDETVNENTKQPIYKDETFIFVHQTFFQQRLLRRYNHVLYISEINCNQIIKKTLPYEIYVLLIQTNIGYQIICTIVVSKQRYNGITEALTQFVEWNNSSLPRFLFIDYSEKLSAAVEKVFPGLSYFYNKHSCLNHWIEFLQRPPNQCEEYLEEVISYLDSMADSYTEESLNISASVFEASHVWQSSSILRTWFQNNWLNQAKRWVVGYRPDDMIVFNHLREKLEDSFQFIEHDIKRSAKPNGLYQLLVQIITKLPEKIEKAYSDGQNKILDECRDMKMKTVQSNFEKVYGICSLLLQSFCSPLVEVVENSNFVISRTTVGNFAVELEGKSYEEPEMSKIRESVAQEEVQKHFEKDSIIEVELDSEEVERKRVSNNLGTSLMETSFSQMNMSKIEPGEFILSFGDHRTYPFCTCAHWTYYKLPCLHMLAVFYNVSGWNFEMLSPLYRSFECLNIDYSCVSEDHTKRKTTDMSTQTEFSSSETNAVANQKDIDERSKLLFNECQNLLNKFRERRSLVDEKKHRVIENHFRSLSFLLRPYPNENKVKYISSNNPSRSSIQFNEHLLPKSSSNLCISDEDFQTSIPIEVSSCNDSTGYTSQYSTRLTISLPQMPAMGIGRIASLFTDNIHGSKSPILLEKDKDIRSINHSHIIERCSASVIVSKELGVEHDSPSEIVNKESFVKDSSSSQIINREFSLKDTNPGKTVVKQSSLNTSDARENVTQEVPSTDSESELVIDEELSVKITEPSDVYSKVCIIQEVKPSKTATKESHIKSVNHSNLTERLSNYALISNKTLCKDSLDEQKSSGKCAIKGSTLKVTSIGETKLKESSVKEKIPCETEIELPSVKQSIPKRLPASLKKYPKRKRSQENLSIEIKKKKVYVK